MIQKPQTALSLLDQKHFVGKYDKMKANFSLTPAIMRTYKVGKKIAI